jgi:hypothetical protein
MKRAWRMIKTIPDEWIPARINGEDVNTRIFIPIGSNWTKS